MKAMLLAAVLLPLLAANTLAQQKPETEEAPPEPAVPISSPKEGMRWRILIGDSADDRNPMIISGMQGQRVRADSAKLTNGNTKNWYTMLGRVFFLRGDQLVEASVEDSSPSASHSFFVSGFPGIHWVQPGTEAEVLFDADRKTWLAIYTQKAAPWKQLQGGDEAIYVPDGPVVDVEATFDALTGLPLYAKVGGKLYRYEIQPTGAGEPQVPAEMRRQITEKLRREAALVEAVRRQENR